MSLSLIVERKRKCWEIRGVTEEIKGNEEIMGRYTEGMGRGRSEEMHVENYGSMKVVRERVWYVAGWGELRRGGDKTEEMR